MNPTRRFPFHHSFEERRRRPTWPQNIPWDLIAPHEEQAQRNHQQTLEQLALRCGLDVLEMYAVLTDREFAKVKHLDRDVAMNKIKAMFLQSAGARS